MQAGAAAIANTESKLGTIATNPGEAMKRLFLLAAFALFVPSIFAQTPLYPSRYTVATLPAASSLTNKVVDVTDALAPGDCTIGGGTYKTPCISNGSTWDPWGALGSGTGTVTNVFGTPPINSSGGATPTISIDNAAADGSTKGAASFTAADFNSSSGNISIDYTNGQAADATHKGFLPSADWTTFNAKLSPTLADGKIFVGNGSNVATAVTPSGDVTLTNAGVIAIGAGKVISSMLNITTSTCTNQFLTAISATGIGTCATDTLASAQHANQGTVITLLHGNAAGNPSFGQIVNADIANSTIDLTAKVTGVLPSANGGTGVNNAGTVTNASNTTITGGGTLALGGFTFTVPATGTGVLTSRTITEGNGLAGNTYDLSANRTLALGTPSTLTVSSSNSASGTTHSHAITSSSNPGAAASLLASNSSGDLTLVDLLATSNLWVRDSSTGFASPSTTVVSLQANNRIQSNGYASQTTGWAADGTTGFGDFRYLFTDELHAKAFMADLEFALAGAQRIAKSSSKVVEDFTTPALGASGSLKVEEFSGSTAHVFVDGDLVETRVTLRASDTSLTIASCYGTVTYVSRTAASNTTPSYQTYTFARPSDASVAGGAFGTISAGSIATDFGTSANKWGYYEVNAVDGANAANSPYAQIVTSSGTGGPAVQANRTVRTRLGNLNGITGVAEYGLYAGNVVDGSTLATTNRYIRLTDTNFELNNLDLNIYNSGARVIALNYSTPYFAIGNPAPSSWLQASSNGIWMGNSSGTYVMRVGAVNSGSSLTSGFSWDGTSLTVIGGITANTGAIGGWTISSGGISSSGIALVSSATLANNQIFVGTGVYNNSNTAFYVDGSGKFSLKDKLTWDGTTLTVNGGGTFSGALSAASGTFAGSLTAASGAITGTLTMSGASSAIAIGSTPPTSASAGTGIWEDRTGIYGLLSNVVQAKFDAVTGKITAGAGAITIGAAGLNVTGTGLLTVSTNIGTTSADGLVFNYGGGVGDNFYSSRIRMEALGALGGATDAYSFTAEARGTTKGSSGGVLVISEIEFGGGDLLAIRSNGNVGIGTISPNAMLDVRGDGIITGLLKAGSGPTTLTDSAGKILSAALNTVAVANGGTGVTTSTGTGNVVLSASPTFTGTITAAAANFSGNVGVGTSGSSTLLDVRGAGNSSFFNFSASSGGTGLVFGTFINTGGTAYLGLEDSGPNSLATGVLAYAAVFGHAGAHATQLITNGNARLTISSAGAIQFNTYGVGTITSDASGNLTSVSDLTVKRDIRPFTRGLNDLMGLKPIMYGYTKESGLDQTKDDYVGYGAQNVQKFIPEAVGHDANGKLTLWDRPILDTAINSILQVNSKVNEQSAEIKSLQSTIESLEKKVADLEKRRN